MIDIMYLLVETQPIGVPSAEILKALTELMKSLDGQSPQTASSWLTPTGLTAAAALINAIAWPALTLLVIVRFRPQLAALLQRITKLELLGFKAEIEKELKKSADEAAAQSGLSKAPSKDEMKRSEEIQRILTPSDLAFVREQVDALANEYETIRASMLPGDPRTRRMEIVVSKMRTIGRAAFGLRYNLLQSPSPGRRLQAIASLQVIPDFELLNWLADRIRDEKPFVGYHALIALNTAARDEHADAYLNELRTALKKAQINSEGLPAGADRMQMLRDFEEQVDALTLPVDPVR